MTASNGSLMIFIDRPISLSLLILTVIILVFPMAKSCCSSGVEAGVHQLLLMGRPLLLALNEYISIHVSTKNNHIACLLPGDGRSN